MAICKSIGSVATLGRNVGGETRGAEIFSAAQSALERAAAPRAVVQRATDANHPNRVEEHANGDQYQHIVGLKRRATKHLEPEAAENEDRNWQDDPLCSHIAAEQHIYDAGEGQEESDNRQRRPEGLARHEVFRW